jgi:hypothetical protein
VRWIIFLVAQAHFEVAEAERANENATKVLGSKVLGSHCGGGGVVSGGLEGWRAGGSEGRRVCERESRSTVESRLVLENCRVLQVACWVSCCGRSM